MSVRDKVNEMEKIVGGAIESFDLHSRGITIDFLRPEGGFYSLAIHMNLDEEFSYEIEVHQIDKRHE